MENSVWRPVTRVVAFVDLVVLYIGCALLGVIFGVFGVITGVVIQGLGPLRYYVNQFTGISTSTRQEIHDFLSNAPASFYVLVWMSFVLCLLMAKIQSVATFKLVNATKLGIHPRNALKRTHFWRSVQFVIIFVVIILAFLCTPMLGIFGVVQYIWIRWAFLVLVVIFVWRVGFLWIVCNFITELESVVIMSSILGAGKCQPLNDNAVV